MQMCQIFNRLAKIYFQFLKHISRPLPLFETHKKEDKFFSKVRVGALAVFDQNSLGSASLAESQGKAAYTWLTTFPNIWMESVTLPKAAPSPSPPVLDHARPFNLVGQLNSAEKIQSSGFAGSNGDSQNDKSSSLKLKPLSMLVQKEVKVIQPGVEVTEQMVPGPDTWKGWESGSSWEVMKRAEFVKSNHTRRVFWESNPAVLVMSAVEIRTLAPDEAADMLGVDVREVEKHVNKLKNEKKRFNQGGSLSNKALSKIKFEACVRELGDRADRSDANKRGQAQKSDQVDNIEERGVKRKASSRTAWITGEVVTHLLKRSFSMKDQFFPLDCDKSPVHVLRMSLPFYESNVKRVVKEIDEYCGFTELLMESGEVQELLKAARNLDNQKMESGGYALAPAYNYSRCMLEKKADYWETGLPALLLQDVDNGMIPAEVAACQLGVTTTMVLAAIAGLKSQDKFSSLWEAQKGFESQEDSDDAEDPNDKEDSDDDDDGSWKFQFWNRKKEDSKKRSTRITVQKQKLSGPVTVQRYQECGFGSEEDFWEENTTKDVLEKVWRKRCLIKMLSLQNMLCV